MKKLLSFLWLSALVSVLVACGSSNESDGSAAKETSGANVESGEDSESAETDNEEKKDVYFKDNEVKTEDRKIEIKETKVIPVGEEGNEHGENPVFAIWYDTTNLSDRERDPTTAWMTLFTAIQDNDPNAVNELDVGTLPDDSHRDSQLEDIKKGGTVENSVAYELDDLETPVTLVATEGVIGDEIGRQDYEIK